MESATQNASALPDRQGGTSKFQRSATRAIKWMGALWLVLLVVFAVYYTVDQRSAYHPPQQAILSQQIQAAEEVVRNNPTDIVARVNMANLYAQASNYKVAAEQYRAALELNPTSLPAANGLAAVYSSLGKPDQAAPVLEQAIAGNQGQKVLRTSDDMGEAHLRLGQIYLSQGKVDEARKEAEAARQSIPADADVLVLLGQTYARTGDFQSAIGWYTKALQMVPRFTEAYESLAAAYDGLGDKPHATYARDMVIYSRGDFAKAAGELEKLVQSEPNLAEAHMGLGMAYERQDRSDRAAAEYKEAVRLDPSLLYARDRLSNLGGQ